MSLPCVAVTTVVSDGGNLVAAVKSAANGDTIEIRSNETFVGTLGWGGKFLTIQAGDGFHPTIKGSPYLIYSPTLTIQYPAITSIYGSLGSGGTFRNLRFEPGEPAPGQTNPGSAIQISTTGTKWSDLTFSGNEFAGGVSFGGTGNFTVDADFQDNRFLSGLSVSGTGQAHVIVTATGNAFLPPANSSLT